MIEEIKTVAKTMFKTWLSLWYLSPVVMTILFIWLGGFAIKYIISNEFMRSVVWFIPDSFFVKNAKGVQDE